jgi:hypothetical protein
MTERFCVCGHRHPDHKLGRRASIGQHPAGLCFLCDCKEFRDDPGRCTGCGMRVAYPARVPVAPGWEARCLNCAREAAA